MKWRGGLFGFALAVATALIFPTLGFTIGLLLGGGLTGLGLLIGAAAERPHS